MRQLKIGIVVHGRFYAFDLARELLERGHDVTVFTNYPGIIAARFGVPADRTRSFLIHGLASRAAMRLRGESHRFYPEALLHRAFGRWAARNLNEESWDVMLGWSGVSEEPLQRLKSAKTVCALARGSAHIREQSRLLVEEESRVGFPLDRPSQWMIDREEREYALADKIVVPSTFAKSSFRNRGVPVDRVFILPLASNLQAFRPSEEIVEERCRRIRAGAPIRVLYVGTLSYQKGLADLAAVIRALSHSGTFHFRCVGPVTQEASELVSGLREQCEFFPSQPEHELPAWYSWGDLFLFPTIQDGFAVVLSQARASALPIITTTNCGGPDILDEGVTGWILPIRSPDRTIEVLRECDAKRDKLAAMVRSTYDGAGLADWSDVAECFEEFCLGWLASKAASA